MTDFFGSVMKLAYTAAPDYKALVAACTKGEAIVQPQMQQIYTGTNSHFHTLPLSLCVLCGFELFTLSLSRHERVWVRT